MRNLIRIILLGSVVLLGGCAARELEDREFARAMELTLEDGRLAGGFGDFLAGGESVGEIRDAYQRELDKYLDLGHIQVIVLGEELLADAERTRAVLLELEQMPLISRSSLVFTHAYEAGESYLAGLKEQHKDPGAYLADRQENNPAHSAGTTLGDLLDRLEPATDCQEPATDRQEPGGDKAAMPGT